MVRKEEECCKEEEIDKNDDGSPLDRANAACEECEKMRIDVVAAELILEKNGFMKCIVVVNVYGKRGVECNVCVWMISYSSKHLANNRKMMGKSKDTHTYVIL